MSTTKIEQELYRQTRSSYEFIVDYGSWLRAAEKFILANFTDEDPISSIYVNASYNHADVTIYLTTIQDDADARMEFLHRMAALFGKLDKKFDESYGRFKLKGVKDDINVVFEIGPPTACTIERVETEEDVPAVEAHKRKVVRYVATGDCDPLLAPKPPVSEPIDIDSPLGQVIRHEQATAEACNDAVAAAQEQEEPRVD